MNKKILKTLFASILLIYSVSAIIRLGGDTGRLQWDFRMQYHAGKMFSEGENPYDAKLLSKKSGSPHWYAYPPITLFFYRAFAFLRYDTAYYSFLVFKCFLLAGLLFLWKNAFLKRETDLFFYLFCLFAFNSCIYLDLRAGNINMLEQFLLWMGFFFYVRRQLLLFSAFIIAAASFKVTPIFFLILPLFTEERKKYAYFIGSIGAFAVVFLLQYIADPRFFSLFLKGAQRTLGERGIIAPSTCAFVKDVFSLVAQQTGITVPHSLQLFLVAAIGAAVILITHQAVIIVRSLQEEDKRKIILFLACLVYALIHPRFKDYAYILLLAPAYYILKKACYLKAFPFILILTLLSARNITLPGMHPVFSLLWSYYPLIIAYCVWGLYMSEILARIKNPPIQHGVTSYDTA